MLTTHNPTTTHDSSTGHVLAASAWLDTHFLAMQPEYEEMLRWVGLQPGWHVLDAASGSGSFLPLMTELVGNGGKVSALDLPYADQSFDAVWCANTTQYLNDDELRTMLKEFRRVVRPGGLIAIKEYDVTTQMIQPTPPTLFPRWHQAMVRVGDQYYHNLFRAIQLAQWLRAAGLTVIRQKPTLMTRFQPLRPVERQFICDFLPFAYKLAQKTDLPAEELMIWQALADVDSPDHVTNHPDFQYRAVQTVFVGQVP